jgi:hypothetical protein
MFYTSPNFILKSLCIMFYTSPNFILQSPCIMFYTIPCAVIFENVTSMSVTEQHTIQQIYAISQEFCSVQVLSCSADNPARQCLKPTIDLFRQLCACLIQRFLTAISAFSATQTFRSNCATSSNCRSYRSHQCVVL